MDKALAWVPKSLTGAVIGAAVVGDDIEQRFWVLLAVIAIAWVAVYARRVRGAPIHSWIVAASLVLACFSTGVVVFGPEAVQAYALLAAGLLTLVGVLAAEHFARAVATLGGVALIAYAAYLVDLDAGLDSSLDSSLAVVLALLTFAIALLLSRARIAGVATILLGVAIPLVGLDGSGSRALTVLISVALVATGVAIVRRRTRLAASARVWIGIGLIGLGISWADPLMTVLGVVVVALAIASLRSSDRLDRAAWGTLGAALLVGAVISFWGVLGEARVGAAAQGEVGGILLTSALASGGLAAIGWSVREASSLEARGLRLRRWWRKATTPQDRHGEGDPGTGGDEPTAAGADRMGNGSTRRS